MIQAIINIWNGIKDFIVDNYKIIIVIIMIYMTFYILLNFTIIIKEAKKISSNAYCQMSCERDFMDESPEEKEEEDGIKEKNVPVKSELQSEDEQFIDRF